MFSKEVHTACQKEISNILSWPQCFKIWKSIQILWLKGISFVVIIQHKNSYICTHSLIALLFHFLSTVYPQRINCVSVYWLCNNRMQCIIYKVDFYYVGILCRWHVRNGFSSGIFLWRLWLLFALYFD